MQAKLLMPQFPRFRYHPDPLATACVVWLETTVPCMICHRMTDYAYRGCFLSGKQWNIGEGVDTPILCPECIANGSAASVLKGSFVNADALDELNLLLPSRRNTAIQELCMRTPGYSVSRSPKWRVHCGDFCAFHGQVRWESMGESIKAQLTKNYSSNPEQFSHSLEQIKFGAADGRPLHIFLFQCLNCGRYLLHIT